MAGRELGTHGLQYACADGAECLRLRPTNEEDNENENEND